TILSGSLRLPLGNRLTPYNGLVPPVPARQSRPNRQASLRPRPLTFPPWQTTADRSTVINRLHRRAGPPL
ncbi:MAG: hypothetical protein ACRD1G_20940, partial [Acidimicrobiales bacterium]